MLENMLKETRNGLFLFFRAVLGAVFALFSDIECELDIEFISEHRGSVNNLTITQ